MGPLSIFPIYLPSIGSPPDPWYRIWILQFVRHCRWWGSSLCTAELVLYLWLLMSALEPSWLLMIAHEPSWAAMTSYEHSWAWCPGARSTHEHSLAIMSTHENGVTSTHKSHGAMAPWHHTHECYRALRRGPKSSWVLLSAYQCSSPWFNNEQKC